MSSGAPQMNILQYRYQCNIMVYLTEIIIIVCIKLVELPSGYEIVATLIQLSHKNNQVYIYVCMA